MESNYFVIDSDNFKNVSSKLYGYIIDGEKIITNSVISPKNLCIKNGLGCYVNIAADNDEIVIDQDYSGSYGLYYFQEDGFFAVSNSFLLLLEHVKSSNITLNNDILASMLAADLSNLAYRQTLVNEISCLSRDEYIVIDRHTGHLFIGTYDHTDENMYEADSKEAVWLLDQWYEKWISIIRKLYEDNKCIDLDLTGGIDSRLVCALFLNAGIDMSNVNVISYRDKTSTHIQDYSIASDIAERYSFALNSNHREINEFSFDDMMQTALYSFTGNSKQFIFNSGVYVEPRYRFTGASGEKLRGYWTWSQKDLIEYEKSKVVEVFGPDSVDIIKSVERVFNDTFEYIKRKYPASIDEKAIIGRYLWNDVADGKHFGKMAENVFNCGEIRMQPLTDPMLAKIRLMGQREHHDILAAIIFERYLPGILEIPFDSNHRIAEKSRQKAKKLNELYPYHKQEHIKLFRKKKENTIEIAHSKLYGSHEANAFLKKCLFSSKVRNVFANNTNDHMYKSVCLDTYERTCFPLGNAEIVLVASYVLDKTFRGGFYSYLVSACDEEIYAPFELVEAIHAKNNELRAIKLRDDQVMAAYSKWVRKPDAVKDFLRKNHVKAIGIYGLGRLGKDLVEYVHAYVDSCEIVFTMDKAAKKDIYDIPLLSPEDTVPDCDIIISTVVGMHREIRDLLQHRTTTEIVSFEEIID